MIEHFIASFAIMYLLVTVIAVKNSVVDGDKRMTTKDFWLTVVGGVVVSNIVYLLN